MFTLLPARMLLLVTMATSAHLSPAGVGVGIGVWPICLSTPAQPGHTYQLTNGGWAGVDKNSSQGVDVVNTGDSNETITLSVQPISKGGRLYGRSLSISPSWISFGYPRQWFGLASGDSVSINPGKQAWIPVTLNLPANAASGAYAANILASTAAPPESQGGSASFGAGAETSMLFLVNMAKPPASWPESVTSPCWDPTPKSPLWWTAPPGPNYVAAPAGWHYDYQKRAWVAPPGYKPQPTATDTPSATGRHWPKGNSTLIGWFGIAVAAIVVIVLVSRGSGPARRPRSRLL